MLYKNTLRRSAHTGWLAIAALLTGCMSAQLEPWHTVPLDAEFTRSMADQVRSYEDYLALEDRLFAELEDKLSSQVGPGLTLNRFSKGSLSSPGRNSQNWNRSWEIPPKSPRGAVLLLHGLTDSPYTLRHLGRRLSEQGYHVLGLRLPGHGAAPSALRSFHWSDVSTAARLALRHLDTVSGNAPLHVIGYSFGAPVAVNLALDAQETSDLKVPSSLVLISPAIGVTGAAAFAGTVNSIASLPGLAGRGWSRIVPEFDPYKFNSFTFNAGSQVYKLSRRVSSRVAARSKRKPDNVLPPVLVLQSTVDATVTTQAIVDQLFSQLAADRHELVLFDLNRNAAVAELLINDPGPFTARTMARDDLPFTFSLVTNRNTNSAEVELRQKAPNSAELSTVTPLGLTWPDGVFSLSHIALPFPANDPLYGATPPENGSELFLGNSRFVGETGQLLFPTSWLMRLRHNPFYSYLEQRAVGWIEDHS